jgi:hypothetical protein
MLKGWAAKGSQTALHAFFLLYDENGRCSAHNYGRFSNWVITGRYMTCHIPGLDSLG